MKKLLKLLPFLTIILFLSSCSDDDDPIIPVSNTIVDVAVNNNLTSLVAAVTRADLASTLAGPGPFTVFAPTNAAFQELLDANGWDSVDDIPVEDLRAVLLFHTLSGKVRSNDLSDTYVNTLSEGPNDEAISLQVEVSGAIEFNGDAKPVTVDVEASNGVVHVIDKVMLPPTIVDLALNNAGFTSLVAALTDPRHTNIDFVEVLSGDGPFTVFAPTNDAFQALLDLNNDWNSLGDIPIATLEAVLLYHVVDANVQSDELTNGDVPTLLSGSDITIDKDNLQINTTSGQDPVNIIINDVQGWNGVVHAIDAVLLP